VSLHVVLLHEFIWSFSSAVTCRVLINLSTCSGNIIYSYCCIEKYDKLPFVYFLSLCHHTSSFISLFLKQMLAIAGPPSPHSLLQLNTMCFHIKNNRPPTVDCMCWILPPYCGQIQKIRYLPPFADIQKCLWTVLSINISLYWIPELRGVQPSWVPGLSRDDFGAENS
jgi:hypothetical protein